MTVTTAQNRWQVWKCHGECFRTRLIELPEFRDRLLKLQGEVLAWKSHNLRLLTEAAKGEESGVKRMIVKYGGTMLGFRLSALAVDLGRPRFKDGDTLSRAWSVPGEGCARPKCRCRRKMAASCCDA